jgi:tetratricopeptide (TPR) repeat protein
MRMRKTGILCVLALLAGLAQAEESAWTILERGIKAYRNNDLRRAEELFTSAVARQNDCHDAYFYLGMIAEKRRRPRAAAEFYRKVADTNGTYPVCQQRLGQLTLAAGDRKQAVQHFAVYAKLRPTTLAWMQVATLQIDLKQFKEAEASLEEAGKYSKGNLDLAEMRARLFMETDRPAAALTEYSKILKVVPTDNNARYLRGLCLNQLHESRKARGEFEQVLVKDPWHGGALRAMVRMLEDAGERKDLVKEYRRRLTILAKNPPKVRPVSGKDQGAPPPPRPNR